MCLPFLMNICFYIATVGCPKPLRFRKCAKERPCSIVSKCSCYLVTSSLSTWLIPTVIYKLTTACNALLACRSATFACHSYMTKYNRALIYGKNMIIINKINPLKKESILDFCVGYSKIADASLYLLS